MTPEELDDLEKVSRNVIRVRGEGADPPAERLLLVAGALRAAWARIERLRGLADEKAHDAGLYARRMEEAQKARSEALAEAKKWHLKYDCLKGDADVAVIEMNAAVEFADNAKAEVERLREVVRQVHALAEKTMLDAWCVGIGREKLREIHKITKGMVE